MKVEACKICDMQCGFCKYDCNCKTLVEVEDGTKRPRPEIVEVDIFENGRKIGTTNVVKYN